MLSSYEALSLEFAHEEMRAGALLALSSLVAVSPDTADEEALALSCAPLVRCEFGGVPVLNTNMALHSF